MLAAASCVATFLAQGEAVTPFATADILADRQRPGFLRGLHKAVFLSGGAGSALSPSGQAFLPIGKPSPPSALSGISAGALVWRRRFPYLFVGWFWYVGMLVPMIGLVQVGLQAMADRYTYLPQIGLCVAVVWGVAHAVARRPCVRRACGVASALVVLVLMGCSWRQTSYWRDSETLWTRTLACTSQNAVAHNNFGIVLAARGRDDAAIDHYRQALDIDPDNVDAHNNLGNALLTARPDR